MGPGSEWLIIAGVLILIAGFAAMKHFGDKKRTRELLDIARELGFEFHPTRDMGWLSFWDSFEVMKRGRSRKIRNFLGREHEGVDAAIFDFQYTTGSGKNSHTHRQTMVSFISKDLKLPPFTLSPENLLHRVASVFGYSDINFQEAPAFSKMFVLRSPDPTSIRELMTPERLHALETFPGIQIEARDSQLLIWYRDRLKKPTEIVEFFKTAFEIYVIFKG